VGVARRRDFLRAGLFAATAAMPWRARAASGPRVVVAGGGFAGAGCALALRRLAPGIAVTVVDPHPRYVTCPMSNAVIAELRNLESITVTRAGLERAGVRYMEDTVTGIEAGKNAARLLSGNPLAYDRLVVAPGIRLLYGQPQGYDQAATLQMPHAWEGGVSTRLLARHLKTVPDGGTVAISVPAGLMRCPPGPYERASLIAHWLKTHRTRCKILIFDSNNHFPRQDVFSASWAELYPGMIEWIPPAQGGMVTRVDVASRTLYSATGAHRVSLANIIPPQAAGLVAQINDLSSGHGWCPVDPVTFESQVVKHVHVIGDACIAGVMPKAASAARSQALQCAAAICALLEDRRPAVAELDSVCYSLVSPATALAMHGRFRASADRIEQIEAGNGPETNTSATAAHLSEANAWYLNIRAGCFGV
jgi:NADPH-dependent 2,4-dienoyl-CoA reductase/sulfur reductase-like enzyme